MGPSRMKGETRLDMDRDELEQRIVARGMEVLRLIGGHRPSVFRRGWWTGKMMAWATRDEAFKGRLFRFIESLPRLTTAEALGAAMKEHLTDSREVPSIVRWPVAVARALGPVGLGVAGWVIRRNARAMARQFIVGGDLKRTVRNLGRLRSRGYAFTVDVLGEAVDSDAAADRYAAQYMAVLDALGRAQGGWPALGGGDGADWGDSPRINVSIKPSALTSHVDEADVEATVGQMLGRLRGVYRKVVDLGATLCIDMENLPLKDITFELYRQLRGDAEFRHWPHLTLAVQCYLRDADADLAGLLAWARDQDLPISVRLVKGAYWDQEVAAAESEGRPCPVYTVKADTDAAFERAAETVLRIHEICHLACASHNVRSVSAVLETARSLSVPADRTEFQILYGMAEPFRNALLLVTPRVRLYCPHGDLLGGMAYLVRRLLENTSNESFLRQEYIEATAPEQLLASPQDLPNDEQSA